MGDYSEMQESSIYGKYMIIPQLVEKDKQREMFKVIV